MMLRDVFERGRALSFVVTLVACTAARVPPESAAPGIAALSAGRVGAIIATLGALIGVVNGGLALARRRSADVSRRRAGVAAVASLIAIAAGGSVIALSGARVGTGNGAGGAIAATVLGLLGVTLAALALSRSRRTP